MPRRGGLRVEAEADPLHPPAHNDVEHFVQGAFSGRRYLDAPLGARRRIHNA